jgi:hypothetical protein
MLRHVVGFLQIVGERLMRAGGGGCDDRVAVYCML